MTLEDLLLRIEFMPVAEDCKIMGAVQWKNF